MGPSQFVDVVEAGLLTLFVFGTLVTTITTLVSTAGSLKGSSLRKNMKLWLGTHTWTVTSSPSSIHGGMSAFDNLDERLVEKSSFPFFFRFLSADKHKGRRRLLWPSSITVEQLLEAVKDTTEAEAAVANENVATVADLDVAVKAWFTALEGKMTAKFTRKAKKWTLAVACAVTLSFNVNIVMQAIANAGDESLHQRVVLATERCLPVTTTPGRTAPTGDGSGTTGPAGSGATSTDAASASGSAALNTGSSEASTGSGSAASTEPPGPLTQECDRALFDRDFFGVDAANRPSVGIALVDVAKSAKRYEVGWGNFFELKMGIDSSRNAVLATIGYMLTLVLVYKGGPFWYDAVQKVKAARSGTSTA